MGWTLMNLAKVHHTMESNWDFNQAVSMTQSSEQSKDVKKNSETRVTSTYTPGPYDAELAELAKQYPDAARDHKKGMSIEQIFKKYPEIAQQYADHPALTQQPVD